MKKNFLLTSIFFGVLSFAQVGLNTSLPQTTLDVVGNPTDTSKFDGVIAPRITGNQLRAKTYTTAHTGALVYVTAADTAPAGQTVNVTAIGYYYFDGTKWVRLNYSSIDQPALTGINCNSARLSPPTYTQGQPYTGVLYVPYTGGNGGVYPGGTPVNSTGVTGLTATLQPGTLASGSGELVYAVTGTPSASSPQTASFAISAFGQSCTATVGASATAETSNNAVMDNFRLTTENGVTGYQVMVTSPDGKFSVRAFIVSKDFDVNSATFGTDALTGMNLQLRNNQSTAVSISGQYEYLWSGAGGNGSNLISYKPGIWSGDNSLGVGNTTPLLANELDGTTSAGSVCGNPAATQTRCRFLSWGNAGVYAGGIPENRLYMWSLNGETPIDKTFYILTFSSSSSNPGLTASTANCPGGVCPSVKAFLKIEQIKAQ
ncbi:MULTISPECIES: hypothetical protein [unclassified Chryseobacterium]|uniref:hypothetical protein n=1 Tax=unclassified Chryseobacterium TaxID=2593645 RepID=UPI000F45D5C8|nr:hypothetical protein [Chryseobacterium sp. G0240]ROI01897.1 hypothetical protein EGI16_16500 [Chryseobacterium sp. G0240]